VGERIRLLASGWSAAKRQVHHRPDQAAHARHLQFTSGREAGPLPGRDAAYPSSEPERQRRRTRVRNARCASSCRERRTGEAWTSDRSTTICASGNARPRCQLGIDRPSRIRTRPRWSENEAGWTIGQRPDAGNGRSFGGLATRRASVCCDGHATAVTRPTVTHTRATMQQQPDEA